jgi:hypothetical protein
MINQKNNDEEFIYFSLSAVDERNTRFLGLHVGSFVPSVKGDQN